MFRQLLAASVLTLALSCTTSADVISEFFPNPPGGDPGTQSIELSGTANAAFDLWILSIDSDPGTGTVDRATNVSGTYDANGLSVVTVDDLENPSFTVVLASDFTGNIGDDLDTDNDGTIDDFSTITGVMDAIGVPDTTGEQMYGDDFGGVNFEFTGDEPRLIFRSGSTGAWFAVNDPDNGEVYDITGTEVFASGAITFSADPLLDTFGGINPIATAAVPEPASCMVLGLFGLTLISRRKK